MDWDVYIIYNLQVQGETPWSFQKEEVELVDPELCRIDGSTVCQKKTIL